MKKFIFSLFVVALLAGVITQVPQLSAQDMPPQPSADAQKAATVFTGTITMDGGKLVLQDQSSNVTYQLDDQKTAKKYEGKTVKVMGSLDSSSNTIHVQDIKVSS